jgi:hypothetical protein
MIYSKMRAGGGGGGGGWLRRSQWRRSHSGWGCGSDVPPPPLLELQLAMIERSPLPLPLMRAAGSVWTAQDAMASSHPVCALAQ